MTTINGDIFSYNKLCICSGANPKLITQANEYVLGIRDTETVAQFQKRLKKARRVVVVGNGGIATELVYEIENCEILWAIKDETITHTFIDAGAATFFLPRLSKVKTKSEDFRPVKRSKYEIAGECKRF